MKTESSVGFSKLDLEEHVTSLPTRYGTHVGHYVEYLLRMRVAIEWNAFVEKGENWLLVQDRVNVALVTLLPIVEMGSGLST